ncbi:MAG: SHD1 domain-containing protein, partial [Planctomycetales bacterium]
PDQPSPPVSRPNGESSQPGNRNGRPKSAKASFQVGDRVEIETIRGWKPGKVTGIDKGFKRIEVLLDKPDVPDRLLAKMPKSMLARLREKSASFSDARLLNSKETSPNEKPRKWTSKHGDFIVEGTFRGLSDDKITVEKPDGGTHKIAINQLSEADVAHARSFEKAENPVEGTADSPAALAPIPAPPVATKTANWRGVKTLRPKSFTRWTFQPQSSEAIKAPGGPSIPLPKIPNSKAFFEKEIFRVGVEGVLVARKKGEVGGDEQWYAQSIDPAKGSVGGLAPLPAEHAVLDLHPSGRVAYRPDYWGFGKNGQLTIAQLEGTELKTICSWKPYEGKGRLSEPDLADAWFLGKDRVMTLASGGRELTIWNASEARALLNLPIDS